MHKNLKYNNAMLKFITSRGNYWQCSYLRNALAKSSSCIQFCRRIFKGAILYELREREREKKHTRSSFRSSHFRGLFLSPMVKSNFAAVLCTRASCAAAAIRFDRLGVVATPVCRDAILKKSRYRRVNRPPLESRRFFFFFFWFESAKQRRVWPICRTLGAHIYIKRARGIVLSPPVSERADSPQCDKSVPRK